MRCHGNGEKAHKKGRRQCALPSARLIRDWLIDWPLPLIFLIDLQAEKRKLTVRVARIMKSRARALMFVLELDI